MQLFEVSSATVELAALALNVEPARIAKTLAFHDGDGCLLVVAAGDARIDNVKFKACFNMKARMLSSEQALEMTGHAVGGVCPFALPKGVRVFLDVSLQRFEQVFPAVGSSNSAICLTCDELFSIPRQKLGSMSAKTGNDGEKEQFPVVTSAC